MRGYSDHRGRDSAAIGPGMMELRGNFQPGPGRATAGAARPSNRRPGKVEPGPAAARFRRTAQVRSRWPVLARGAETLGSDSGRRRVRARNAAVLRKGVGVRVSS
eukprot:750939-Hanusia_phi.AAC.3